MNIALINQVSAELSSFGWPLLLAVVLSGAVGMEREVHGRPAGLRTHVLVCVCSTMLVHASLHLPQEMRSLVLGVGDDAGRLVVDPNRLSAGIVTGIGFLGAATVIRSGDLVRGVTTAACIWFVAGLGVVIGNGADAIAVSATVVVIASLLVLDRLSNHLPEVVYRRILVRGDAAKMSRVSESVSAALSGRSIRTQDVTGALDSRSGEFKLEYHLRLRRHIVSTEFLEELAELDGVDGVEWTGLEHD